MIRRERLAGRIKGSAIILWGQVALIALWMLSFDKFEYASLDYLFCGVVGLFCLWKNQGIIRGGYCPLAGILFKRCAVQL